MMNDRRQKESGFALLLVFLMAAAVSIMLYRQLPRAAFESQRGKEELLQDRGEQYIRAIQLYVAKWRRFPADLDSLEKTNNVRYLRRRYKDPMTGKDEWRAVHVDGAGQLTDSIIQKTEKKKEALQEFVSELPTVGSTAATVGGEGAQNVALRRRASDSNVPGAPAVAGADPSVGNQAYAPPPPPNAPNQFQQQQQQQLSMEQPQIDPNTGLPQQPQLAGQQPQLAGQQPQLAGQQPQLAGQQPQLAGQQPQAGMPAMPGMPPGMSPPGVVPGQTPSFPQPQGTMTQQQQILQQQQQLQQQLQQQYQQQQRMQQQQQPTMPNAAYPVPVPAQAGGMPQGGFAAPRPPGAANMPPTPTGQPGAQNAGLDMINKILTTPRANMNTSVPGAPGLQIGGGIAGFASTMEAPSIKVYNERQKYNEWEFIYDMKKDKRLVGAAAAAGGNGMPQNNNPLGGSMPTGSTTPNNIPNPMMNPANPQQGSPNPTGPQAPTYPFPGRR